MIIYKNIKIIGTSHIAKTSIEEVKHEILTEKPEFVALELDKDRFIGLMNNKRKSISAKDILELGVSGFIFTLLGEWLEKKLGKIVGTKPGGEMKVATHSAALVGAKILLIDQSIKITIKRMFKSVTFKEKMRFVLDILKGIFGKGDIEKFDLSKVPSEKLIEKMILSVKDRYPSIYLTLIEERNKFMAKKLHNFSMKYPESKIIAVVGAGHEIGMIEEIKKYK